jgi:pimeloyl-ACP methyl ester carboxylesterase
MRAFQQLEIPILYMVGKRSTASALAVAQTLVPALPRVRTIEFETLGHMGPVTHPEVVNAEIKRFLSEPEHLAHAMLSGRGSE